MKVLKVLDQEFPLLREFLVESRFLWRGHTVNIFLPHIHRGILKSSSSVDLKTDYFLNRNFHTSGIFRPSKEDSRVLIMVISNTGQIVKNNQQIRVIIKEFLFWYIRTSFITYKNKWKVTLFQFSKVVCWYTCNIFYMCRAQA